LNAPSFTVVRPNSQAEVPAPDQAFIDVHVLDMNHAYHNAGHDSIVALVRRLATDFEPALKGTGASVRLISHCVRHGQLLPVPAEGPALYLGTGGPGHVDPRKNRRDDLESGQIRESHVWEDPLFALFDAIEENDDAMLYGVCHTFGLLCRWSGVAEPVLRGPEKGGPSIGVVENVLTPQALEHPWFARLATHLPDGRHLPVVDSRHYDLIPRRKRFPRGTTPIAYETSQRGGPPGEALTMCEFARKRNGVPRIFGANHHPEIPDASDLSTLLERKLRTGEVTREWYESRVALLEQLQADDHSEPARLLSAGYSFTFLVRDGLRDLIEARNAGRGSAVSTAL
jgi:hypothetical protein